MICIAFVILDQDALFPMPALDLPDNFELCTGLSVLDTILCTLGHRLCSAVTLLMYMQLSLFILMCLKAVCGAEELLGTGILPMLEEECGSDSSW